MLLPAEPLVVAEGALALIEGHLMKRQLRVFASAVTGLVVSDPNRDRVESAAALQPLEKALVLAQRAQADCVFQLIRLEVPSREPKRRYFVLRGGQSVMTEVRADTFATLPQSRRRTVTGPTWEIDGKVIDVKSGAVLAVVGLAASAADQAKAFHLEERDGRLEPGYVDIEWRFDGPADLDYLRTTFMDRLALEIRGGQATPPLPEASEPLLPPAE
jgi:hypothetical protein